MQKYCNAMCIAKYVDAAGVSPVVALALAGFDLADACSPRRVMTRDRSRAERAKSSETITARAAARACLPLLP